jgi:hypothetical protein
MKWDIFIIKIETMKKIIRLTESDLTRIVKRVIKENNSPEKYVFDVNTGEMVGTHRYGVGFVVNRTGERMGYESHPTSIPNGTKMKRNNDDEDFSSLRNNRMSDLYEELGDEIDMSNLQNEIKDFVLTYGNVSNNATDDEIMADLYSLRNSEDRDISHHAIRLTRRL